MDKVNFLRKKSGDFTQKYPLPKINQNEFDTLTLWHPIALIGFLSRNRVRREERWRRRCRWCKGWRSCAVARSSLPLSLLSPSLLLPQWNMQYLRYFLIWCKDTQILEMQKKDWHVSVFGNRKWVWQLWQIIATRKFKQNR